MTPAVTRLMALEELVAGLADEARAANQRTEERLAALGAEHAKTMEVLEDRTTALMARLVTASKTLLESRLAERKLLARIQRLERVITDLECPQHGRLDYGSRTCATLLDAIRADLAATDRERGSK